MWASSASIHQRLSARRNDVNPTAPPASRRGTAGAALTIGVVCIVSVAGVLWLALAPAEEQRMLWTILASTTAIAVLGIGLGWAAGYRMAITRPYRDQAEPDRQRAHSDKDALTGLLDRRTFMSFADDALLYFNRYHRGAAILLVGIDRFAAINDAYGTEVGDRVIGHVADVLDLSLRQTDKISRFNDDQFCIVLREISEADMIALANRMRRAVEDLGLRHDDTIISLTISVGATVLTVGDTKIEAVVARAGKALVAAKQMGRNCVSIRSTPPGADLDQAA